MPLGEKIKRYRKAKGITQTEVAEAMWASATKVSQVENGEGEYSEEQLRTFKEHFGLTDMPFTEFECATFKERLYHWFGLISSGKMDEADTLYAKILPILELESCDAELPMLFRLFELVYLRLKKEDDLFEERLEFLKGALGRMHIGQLYYYYNTMGWVYSVDEKHEEALASYRNALESLDANKELPRDSEERLLYNITITYSKLGLPHQAIMFVKDVKRGNDENKTERLDLGFDIMLALNYTRIGEFKWAERLLTDCYIRAIAIEDKLSIGTTLYNFGLLYKRLKDWKMAINYLDQALEVYDAESDYHLWVCYHKIQCMIENRKFADAERMLKQAKKNYAKNKASLIPLESLFHFLTLSRRQSTINRESEEYIEQVTVPHFLEIHLRFEAVNYYMLLERHHIMVKNFSRASAVASKIRDIQNRIISFS